MINVTEVAASKINELLAEENKVGAGLRVFVQGGGCSGFQYGLMIEEGESSTDADQVFESNGVKLFVDPISIRYLQNAEVDFIDNLTGGGFTIKNPNAKSTCGCGSSLSVWADQGVRRDQARAWSPAPADRPAVARRSTGDRVVRHQFAVVDYAVTVMEPSPDYLETIRPIGGKRSSKRDLIVNVFLRQEGHLS